MAKKKKLVQAPRQLRIERQTAHRSFFDRKSVLFALMTVLLVVLVAALLFLQANKAASDLKAANENNKTELHKAVAGTTSMINALKLQDQDDQDKAFAGLTELTVAANAIADTCVKATGPFVPPMAKSYESLNQECNETARHAREIRDATNAFMPVARYQVNLLNALKPVVAYHRGEEKTDLQKGITAWSETGSALQKINSPESLSKVNSQLINNVAEIITELEKAKKAKDTGNTGEYAAALDRLEQHYGTFSKLAEPVHDQLAKQQNALTKAVKDL